MLILVSGSTKTVKRLASQGQKNLGILLTPANRNSVASVIDTKLPWAIDNGAFSGFDESRFIWLLDRCVGLPRLMWVACPDVVGDAKKTLVNFEKWVDKIRSRGLPVSFVWQDGQDKIPVPWDEVDSFFIGGSTEFKLGQIARDLTEQAKSKNKPIHMGRVNSLRRIKYAYDIGVDSTDGTSSSMFGDRYIKKFCDWSEKLRTNQSLFRMIVEAR